MKIRKNDKIKIVRGKDKGKESVVERVLTKTDKVYAKDVNIYKKHSKGRGIIEMVRALPVTNVQLICPKCEKPTRVGFRLEKGKKVRFCKKCEEAI